jgi:inorganic pyrophosphatase
MDEPAFVGCLLKGRIIGVIEGEEIEDGKKTRNDRIVAIEQANHSFENIKQIHHLGRHFGTNSKSFSCTILIKKTTAFSASKGPRRRANLSRLECGKTPAWQN